MIAYFLIAAIGLKAGMGWAFWAAWVIWGIIAFLDALADTYEQEK